MDSVISVTQDSAMLRTVHFDHKWITIEDIDDLSHHTANAALSDDSTFFSLISSGADFLDEVLREQGTIYGVTTGYGDSCMIKIPLNLISELPHHLYSFLGCGLGKYFSRIETRAIIAVRLTSLCKGYSGVSLDLLRQLTLLLQKDVLPRIPSEGSVGASGDLTPLSYLAAVLCGEREVWHNEEMSMSASEALAVAGISPMQLRPKEGLAVMNGTSVMTALACLAYTRAHYLMQLATRITALASFALDGNAHHFDAALFSVKPHPEQQRVARWLCEDLSGEQTSYDGKRLQDHYSIRCAPHIIGVLADALPWLRQWIENELNSTNDNPIINPHCKRIFHGGHFYGGHIAFAMDSMKNAVANLADLMDRQMALLVDSRFNNGLPSNLSNAKGDRACINHGLKGLQINASAWTAEALKLTMPASVFSRSTECHNQDKVSMGTISARDCIRILELTEQVAAALLITVRQGVWLRCQVNPLKRLSSPLAKMMDALASDICIIEEDRRLDHDLKCLLERIRAHFWKLYQ